MGISLLLYTGTKKFRMPFRIVSEMNGLCVGLNGNEEAIMMNHNDREESQFWEWHDGPTVWALMNKEGNVLTAKGPAVKGAVVFARSYHGGNNQHWTLSPDGQLINKKQGLFLDIKGGNKVVGTPLHVWPKNGALNQKWKLEEYVD